MLREGDKEGVFPAIISLSAQKFCREQKQRTAITVIFPVTDSFVLSLTLGGRPVGVL